MPSQEPMTSTHSITVRPALHCTDPSTAPHVPRPALRQAELGLSADLATGADGAAAGQAGGSGGGDPSGAAAAAAPLRPQTELPLQQLLMSQQLQQLLDQQKQPVAGDGQGKGLGCGGGGAGAEHAGPAKAELACPICLDVCDRRTITTCGHTFCTDCIHDIVQVGAGIVWLRCQSAGTAPWPILRPHMLQQLVQLVQRRLRFVGCHFCLNIADNEAEVGSGKIG
jgi:hypothetical protein